MSLGSSQLIIKMIFGLFNHTLLFIYLQNQTSNLKELYNRHIPSFFTDSPTINSTREKMILAFKRYKLWDYIFGKNLTSNSQLILINKTNTTHLNQEKVIIQSKNNFNFNKFLHDKIIKCKISNISYSIISPQSLSKIQYLESYPYILRILDNIDRVYLFIYISEIILLITLLFIIKKIIKKYIANRKTKKILKLLEFFEDNYSISEITFIKPIKGYDQDIFKKQKHPEKNPSIYSSEYADISPPKHFSNYNEAKEKADKIYAIPENCKDCLGGANLMMYASSTILSNEGFTLYCPSVFGFIRINPKIKKKPKPKTDGQ